MADTPLIVSRTALLRFVDEEPTELADCAGVFGGFHGGTHRDSPLRRYKRLSPSSDFRL